MRPPGFHRTLDEHLREPKVPSRNPNDLAHPAQVAILPHLRLFRNVVLFGFAAGISTAALGGSCGHSSLADLAASGSLHDPYQRFGHFRAFLRVVLVRCNRQWCDLLILENCIEGPDH